MSGFEVRLLDGTVDRPAFDCGNPSLTRYFREQAAQDVRRRVAFCFVASDADGLIGYYTLASATVGLLDLPSAQRKKLPNYGEVPCVLLGRLAIASERQGNGFGAALLADALERTLRADIAAHAILVDPLDDTAQSFYARFGFIHAVESQPKRMFLSLVTVATAMQRAGEPPGAPPPDRSRRKRPAG